MGDVNPKTYCQQVIREKAPAAGLTASQIVSAIKHADVLFEGREALTENRKVRETAQYAFVRTCLDLFIAKGTYPAQSAAWVKPFARQIDAENKQRRKKKSK
jgi:hypothetical protein